MDMKILWLAGIEVAVLFIYFLAAALTASRSSRT